MATVAVKENENGDKTTSQLDKAMKQLEKLLNLQYEAQEGIKRSGTELIVPEFMTYEDAAKAITQHVKQREEETQKTLRFQCHPNDGLVAFYKAMKETFGNIVGKSMDISFLWFQFTIPAQSIAIPIAYGETFTVPIGNVQVPGLPIKMDIATKEDPKDPMKGWVYVELTYKKKFEPLVKKIEKTTWDFLKKHSIFFNQAIDSRFQFINLDVDLSKVVYSQDESDHLNANVFHIITDTKSTEAAGVPLKRTILLYGRYGTGKTLTALKAAQLCVKHGWTFMMVRPGDDIKLALEFARKYEPCLVFFEDVDSVTGGGRDEGLNAVLNTLDGFLGKDAKVMTILTSNHIDHINRAMLRPGRIDEVIKLGIIDERSVVGLVRAYAGDNLRGDLDGKALLEAADGYVPAFVVEAVHKAVMYALAAERGKGNGGLYITSEDVVKSLVGLRDQFKLMEGEQVVEKPKLEEAMITVLEPVVKEGLEAFKEQLNPRVLKEAS